MLHAKRRFQRKCTSVATNQQGAHPSINLKGVQDSDEARMDLGIALDYRLHAEIKKKKTLEVGVFASRHKSVGLEEVHRLLEFHIRNVEKINEMKFYS